MSNIKLFRRATLVAADLALIILATFFALFLRENMAIDAPKFWGIIPYIVLSIAAFVPAALAFSVDRRLWSYSSFPDYLRVALAIMIMVIIATLAMFLFNRMEGVSRSVPVLQGLLSLFTLVGARVCVRALFRAREAGTEQITRNPHERSEQILLIGVNSVAALYLHALEEHGNARVVGIMPLEEEASGRMLREHLVFASHQTLVTVLGLLKVRGITVDRIVVAVPKSNLPPALIRDLERAFSLFETHVDYLPQMLGISSADNAARLALAMAAEPARQGVAYRVTKRAIDFVLSATLLIALSPIILLVALAVFFLHGSPVVFWQERPGRYGRQIRIYKLRTMSDTLDESGRALADSARTSRFSAFLRATRLDETPQLWNILIGEMSFVGPRPLLKEDQLPGAQQRLMWRPGLTGWAQVMGGREISPKEKMLLDLWYCENASLALDARIALATIPMLLRGELVNWEAIELARTTQSSRFLNADFRLSGSTPNTASRAKELVKS